MIEEAVKRYLNRVYGCRLVKVNAKTESVITERKRKLGLKKKVFGIFPVYNYEIKKAILCEWENVTLTQSTGILRVPDVDILICYDDFNDVLYWKYDV